MQEHELVSASKLKMPPMSTYIVVARYLFFFSVLKPPQILRRKITLQQLYANRATTTTTDRSTLYSLRNIIIAFLTTDNTTHTHRHTPIDTTKPNSHLLQRRWSWFHLDLLHPFVIQLINTSIRYVEWSDFCCLQPYGKNMDKKAGVGFRISYYILEHTHTQTLSDSNDNRNMKLFEFDLL